MVESFRAKPGEMNQAGDKARALADDAAAIKPDIGPVKGAMPGSTAAALIEAVQATLEGTLRNWSLAADGYGVALDVAAAGYRGSDRRGAQDYQNIQTPDVPPTPGSAPAPGWPSATTTPGAPTPAAGPTPTPVPTGQGS
ncbi:hypothetical protein KIH74_07075 [Kineosporia sp. J2-2]|uniref:Excreted virulence factor EspC (Type VII ESX diderm) n=1 Tax=Kineosporia corallincola TaxID=2835133 RepID=A0ABS5TC70_9ACTN|nr:hypothetical protein [Kineosporia corallincola]MBT0768682.1 hypothetical protein [Kineosporia corallincola]